MSPNRSFLYAFVDIMFPEKFHVQPELLFVFIEVQTIGSPQF
jgi:hypothetical protein